MHPGAVPAVRFADDGRTVTAPLTRNGDRIRLPSAKWYGEYIDADGITQRRPLAADKTAAQQMLAESVRKAELGKAGIRDLFEEYRLRPLLCARWQSKGLTQDGSVCECPDGAHLTDHRRSLGAKEKEPRYVSQAIAHCIAAFTGTGARFVGDIDARQVGAWLAEFRRDTGAGMSTSNHHLTSVNGLRPHDHAAALEALPSLLPSGPKWKAPALAATGTQGPGDEPGSSSAYRLAYRTGEVGGDSLRAF